LLAADLDDARPEWLREIWRHLAGAAGLPDR